VVPDRAFIAHEGGKLRVGRVREVRSNQDMRDVYTPGVARVVHRDRRAPELARTFTTIGPHGRDLHERHAGARARRHRPGRSMPVMEGKAMFYAQLAGISAVPVLVDTKDVDEFVEAVVRIAPSFGGIHLEDISAPECFEIEERLIEALPQAGHARRRFHGTAVVSLSAAIVACRAGRAALDDAVVGQSGSARRGSGSRR
jgi:malate dehydrogenase (oxaloacetate-decarboxylating)